ncbi:dihydrodipicolinate synthase family protein [Sessilibacter corallicola]|uniref:Dihydrodipicolinate synthase family protein n=1 Tax=Sessilibacter corallicola TaxID=2904075 RepID=A0ABQ0A9P1_9GAMM
MQSNNVYVPLVTPLSQTSSVCEQSVNNLVNYTKTYVTGFIPCLTSGEGWLLNPTQWETMCRYTRLAAPNHQVIAGIEKPTTEEVINYAKLAENIGANGVMITTPFGDKISQDEIIEHYRRVHDSVGINVYIYNESELSNNLTSESTLLTISELERVRGIKDSSNSDKLQSLIAKLKVNNVIFFQGWENKIANLSRQTGNICSLSNLYPRLCFEAANTPSENTQTLIHNLCEHHNIFDPRWYAYIKDHLKNLNLITNNYTLDKDFGETS